MLVTLFDLICIRPHRKKKIAEIQSDENVCAYVFWLRNLEWK